MKLKNPIVIALFYAMPLHSTTFVYNLRIGEINRPKNPVSHEEDHNSAILTAIAQRFASSDTNFHQLTGGILGTYIFAKNHWYFRANAAVGRVHAKRGNTDTFSKTEWDDILFSGGYGWQLDEKLQISFSGYWGIPTHQDHFTNLAQLGTGHMCLGIQLDFAYNFTPQHKLLAASRLIHFMSRDITVKREEVIQLINAFEPGNLVDFLFAYQHSWKQHEITLGYNPATTFGTDDITSADRTGELGTVANTLFASYRYGFMVKNYLSAVIGGLSYGFLKLPAPLQQSHIITAWFTWEISF
jgi:hypothetical protein